MNRSQYIQKIGRLEIGNDLSTKKFRNPWAQYVYAAFSTILQIPISMTIISGITKDIYQEGQRELLKVLKKL